MYTDGAALYPSRVNIDATGVSFVCRFCTQEAWSRGIVELWRRKCLEYVCNTYVTCMEYGCDICGTRVEYEWNMHARCMTYAWNMNGVCTDVHGI